MKVLDIKEAGANEILMWAISNGADIKNDQPLQSIINDEMFYLVTLGNVNFLEVFRLTQMYREKLRIIEEYKADVPPRKELMELFNGNYHKDENGNDKDFPLYEAVEHVTNTFINLVLQMKTDDDIIHHNAQRLFLPMISRKFDVQIPISFIDLIESMSEDESSQLFNENYPNTLNDIITSESHNAINILKLGFLKGTSIIRYNKRYDSYLKVIKYSPLSNITSDKLYKYALLGFHKYNPILRSEIRCSLFMPNKDLFSNKLKTIGRLSTPLKIQFVIQLPIQYMQILENSFSRDELEIMYESSMASILDSGLVYNDFITYETDDDNNDDEEFEKHNNAISAYRVRITEANQILLNTITLLLNSNYDVDVTSTFAMLPSVYSTKAVITIDMSKVDKYINHSEPIISEMFKDILNTANTILEDIKKTK